MDGKDKGTESKKRRIFGLSVADFLTRTFLVLMVVFLIFWLFFKDTLFHKEECEPFLRIVSPYKLTKWEMRNKYSIRWESKCSPGNVRIRLRDHEEYLATLTNSTKDDGEYKYTVLAGLTSGKKYRIRINFIDRSDIYDNSEAFLITDDVEFLPSSTIDEVK